MLLVLLVGVVLLLILVQWYYERHIVRSLPSRAWISCLQKYGGIPGPLELPLIKGLLGVCLRTKTWSLILQVMKNQERMYDWFLDLTEKVRLLL